MKKIGLLIGCVFLMGQINAQIFSIGPRTGFNMASLTHFSEQDKYSENYIQNGQLLSYHAGVVTNVSITRQFSVQAEFLYSKKGHRLNYQEDTIELNIDGYEKYILNYVEVPVLLKLSFGPDEVRGFVNAGPYWGKWLGGKTKTKIDYIIAGESSEVDETHEIDFDADYLDTDFQANQSDFGLIIGGGFMYEAGPGNLLIDFRYTMSLRDINDWKDSSLKPEGYSELKNRVFSISFGYLFWF
ncbi:MAG: PorT family protein [Bacteroidales bacterium]|nr:PorT family protein [Bacteroidales bacterium]MCF8454466.1 PorT family protein [Bacteroidales bacterium]